MNSKHSITKMTSVLLAFILLFTALMPTVSASVNGDLLPAGFRVTRETTYGVVSGVTERHFTINNASNSNQIKSYALEIDLNNPDISIIASYNDGTTNTWARATVYDQASAMEKKLSVNVIGGINGDFFNTSTGEPSGVLVMGGELGHATSGWPYFAILNNGTAVIRSGNVSTADVKEAIGGRHILVKNGVVVSDDHEYLAPRTAVGIKEDGSVVFFVADGRQQPDSCGMDNAQVANTMAALGCVDALGLDGGGSSTMVSRREAGSGLETRNYPSYMGIVRPVSTALLICSSAEPTGVFDHVAFSQDNYLCNPSSWVTISAKGVDENGFAAAIPEGGKLVLSDSSYGFMAGNIFHAAGKSGTVEISYVIDGVVYGTSTIEITKNTDTMFVATLRKFFQTFFNLFNTIQTVMEKLRSGTSNKF